VRLEFADEGVTDVAGMDFTVDVGFAHTAGDELGDLGAEVEDEDFVVHKKCRYSSR
jgi:hypothetical protein